MTTWATILRGVLAGRDLDADEASWAIDALLGGAATDAQIGGFTMAMRAKGESPAEIEAFVAAMLRHARLVEHDFVVLDIVGTGGDQSHSVNISTMAALVAAAAGARVLKHGNRAASSKTGTADVLEALGVRIDLDPRDVATSAREAGIGFCFAPAHHPALRHVGQARRDLGVPTFFNLLGPLANPGLAETALVGVADAARAPLMADVLVRRGVKALVVRGDDGLDEISTTTTTTVWDGTGEGVVRGSLDPRDLGIAPVDPRLLVGGEPARNAELVHKTLRGGPIDDGDAEAVAAIRDVVALNAAAGMVAYRAGIGEPVTGTLVDRIGAQLALTRAIIEQGAAAEVLERWIAVTNRLAG